ncbi:putative virulence factor, MviN [Oceaniovalibus guishaninsula JLT2003]|uniref:Probable lipid II flippase MurJ n=1 Tax=Oceaniovalibus guishaninsula JLT2003 TaxID=1231392 RepID=K2HLT3_9RHOB|nr:murein biosynthesis integral membrane protein MurJ [Oceaniovalibus guishaninsula]EKE43859.1 putative virulence factor, MviN [Oceaniovalibus guishaninsula JLT2003]
MSTARTAIPAPRLMRGFLTVGTWTLASRILGFVREIFIAAALGSGPVAQAFLVAFALPNMFRRFFAEGAFNMAFVPLFSRKLETGADAMEFARDAFAGLTTVLIALTLLAQVFMPALVYAMAAGFAGDERFDLAVVFGRIVFPYILLISLAALLSGVLNASGRFLAAAAAPVALNVILIAALWAGQRFGWATGLTLSWSVLVAGIVQLAVVWIAASRAGFRLLPRLPRMTPDLRKLAIIAAPAALAGGVVQINLLVGRQVGSQFDGAIAWLSYADRLYQLPLGVVGIAIGVVLLPDLSRRLGAQDVAGGRDAMNRAAEFALILSVPCAVAFLIIPLPLVQVLFQRGAFGADDSAATALAVAVYGLGLPAFVLQKVWQPLYFAREDTRTPFWLALVSMLVNVGIAVGLAPALGFIAAAIGTSLAGWTMAILLIVFTRGMGEAARLDARLKRRIWRIVLAALLMGVALWLAEVVLGPALGLAGWRYPALALLIGIGVLSYGWAGNLLGAFSLRDIARGLRRQR